VSTADDPSGRASKIRALVGRMLLGAGLLAVLGALTSQLEGESLGEATIGGAVAGLLIGVFWFWQSQRAHAYRSSVDPTGTVLTRSNRAGTSTPLRSAKARRYKNRPGTVLASICLVGYAAFVTAVWVAADAPVWVRAFFSGLFLLTSSWLVATWLTYTEVGPNGLKVRTPTRRHAIEWSDLSEVRWQRESNRDVLLFRTKDGREIKAAGVDVTDMGYGKERATRAMADIEQTWHQTAA
jgi:hypothetical protein